MFLLIDKKIEILLFNNNILKRFKICIKHKLNHKELFKYINFNIKENSNIENHFIFYQIIKLIIYF